MSDCVYFITDKIIQVQYLHAKEGDDKSGSI
jgi:hypothetical protein